MRVEVRSLLDDPVGGRVVRFDAFEDVDTFDAELRAVTSEAHTATMIAVEEDGRLLVNRVTTYPSSPSKIATTRSMIRWAFENRYGNRYCESDGDWEVTERDGQLDVQIGNVVGRIIGRTDGERQRLARFWRDTIDELRTTMAVADGVPTTMTDGRPDQVLDEERPTRVSEARGDIR